MLQKVARRKRRGKPAAVAAEQRRKQQRKLQAALAARIAEVVQETFEQALADEVTARLGRPKHARRQAAPLRRTGAVCAQCQQDWAPRFRRAGSYRRTLVTTRATVQVRVPRVSCVCGGRRCRCWSPMGSTRRRGSAGCWTGSAGRGKTPPVGRPCWSGSKRGACAPTPG